MADRQRYDVTTRITLTADSADEAGQIVAALLAPLAEHPPFSGKYEPEVMGVQARDTAVLTEDEQATWAEMMRGFGVSES